MSAFSSIPFTTQTVYRIDFQPKLVPIQRCCKVTSKGDEKTRILSNPDQFSLDEPERTNQVEAFRLQICRQYPSLAKLMGKPFDQEVREAARIEVRNTSYTSHYSKPGYLSGRRSNITYLLPNGWIIPSTSHNANYRSPSIWCDANSPASPIRPLDNLEPNMQERQILGVVTGETEYKAKIGTAGKWVMNHNMQKSQSHKKLSVYHNKNKKITD